jgi:hypothetical protein
LPGRGRVRRSNAGTGQLNEGDTSLDTILSWTAQPIGLIEAGWMPERESPVVPYAIGIKEQPLRLRTAAMAIQAARDPTSNPTRCQPPAAASLRQT